MTHFDPKKHYRPQPVTDRGPIQEVELELESPGSSPLFLIRRKDQIITRCEWARIWFIPDGLVLCQNNVPIRSFRDLDKLRNYTLSLTGCELIIINTLKSLNP